MALTIEQEAQQPTGTTGANGGHAGEEFPTPYLGRSLKISAANSANRCSTGIATPSPKIP